LCLYHGLLFFQLPFFPLVFPNVASARMVCDQQPGQPRSCGNVPDGPGGGYQGPSQAVIEQQRQEYERQQRATSYNDAANAALDRGDYDRAIQLYGQAYATNPWQGFLDNQSLALDRKNRASASDHYDAANAALKSGDFDRAILLYDQAYAAYQWQGYLDGKQNAIAGKYSAAARAAWTSGDYERAARLYDQAYAAHPLQGYLDNKKTALELKTANKYNEVANAALKSGDFERAIQLYDQAYAAHPSRGYLDNKQLAIAGKYNAAASTAFKSGDYDRAIQLYDQAYAANPLPGYLNNKNVALENKYIASGKIAFDGKDYEKAGELFDKAYAINPSQSNLDNKKLALENKSHLEPYRMVSASSFSTALSSVTSFAKSLFTTYDSASAQAGAIAKNPNDAGCVYDGGSNCEKGTSLAGAEPRGRGTASLSATAKEAMAKIPDGQKALKDEATARISFARAEAAVSELKAERDRAPDSAAQSKFDMKYTNANQAKANAAQELYTAEIAVETVATKYELDD
jgi:tetratricopeptide (TPR) repeat protein